MKKTLVIGGYAIGGLILVLLILNWTTQRELITEVIIDAPREEVWSVLVDVDKYPEWNPFIISSQGDLREGGRLTNVMVNKGQENQFNPVILTFSENEKYEWLGSALGGAFKGRHYFLLSDHTEGGTKVIHGEEFTGILSGLVIQMIGADTQANFEAMNGAMKARVENER